MTALVRSTIVLAFTSVIAGSAVTAQQQRLASDTARLHDLGVTASRVETSTPVPAAVTILRGDDLRARGVHFLQDALREVPGMMLIQNGSYGAVTSLFLRGGESDYVKVLLDGVPLNAPGGSLNLADLTLANIDRIEVVRGPVSVLYGADAMSGVVQLFTRGGSAQRSGEAAIRSGTFGTRGYDLRVAGGSGRSSLALTGTRFSSNGIYEFNNQYTNQSGTARLDLRDTEGGKLAVTAQLGDVEAGYPTDFAGVPVDRNQQTTERRLTFGALASRPLSATFSGTLHGYLARLDAGATNRPDSPADSLGYGFDSDRSARTSRRGMDARVDSRRFRQTILSLGVGVEQEEITTTSRTAQNYGSGRFEEAGAFATERTTTNLSAQLLMTPVRTLTVQVGARLDDNSAFGEFATWRAGVSWELSRRTRVWGAVGTAFKAPTFAELFADDLYEVGNPTLDPERSTNVEAGATHQLSRGARIEMTAFSQRFRDLIQYIGAAPGDPTYINLGVASSRGLEAAFTLQPTATIGVRAHWTLLDTDVADSGSASSLTFQQGAPLLRRPSASGGVTLTVRERGATVAGTIRHVGHRDDVDYRDFPARRTTLPSYTMLDVAVEVPVGRQQGSAGGMELTFRGENLLDAAYDQVVGFPGRGRTLLMGARLRY